MVVRAGIYIRISRAKRELLDAQRQQPPCEAFAKAQGWSVQEVYLDDSTSAYSGIRRDDFERMFSDVRAGKLDAVISWQMDRLLRTVEDASAIVNIAKQHGTLIANIGGSIDLSTADGRRRFYESAVAAQYESDLRSERLKLKHAELAAEGKWQGGPRPFGYDLEPYPDLDSGRVRYRLVVNDAEAAAIRQAAKDVLEGGSISAITRQWAQPGGVRRPGGGVFWDSRIREVLVSPRTAGLRHADGKLVQAEWEPILTKEQHLELRAILGPQRRERATGRLPTARSYLLGGLAYCGRCGARLRSKPSGGRRRYFCEPRYGGCGGLKRVADPLEAHVVWRLLLKLPERLLAAARRAPEEWETLGRLMTARQTEEDRLEGFADFLADETWDRPTYLRQKKRVQDRLNELDAKITHLRASAPRRRLKGATLGELQAEWDRLDLEDQRALLADHVEKVVIKPVGRGKHFDPAAVEIHWK